MLYKPKDLSSISGFHCGREAIPRIYPLTFLFILRYAYTCT
ncbi:rCG37718 [Rattus norvegicus]|uniref:RCG37718 n=1 Tax=Rattus norvegicus TaxID=10116 RepID=A6JEX0_RAT|nr:rCG37718 [Rattus norvegicus]